jgi:putative transposase
MASKAYQISDRENSKALREFLAREGQLLLPMVELITRAEIAVDEVIDVMGRATIEAVLTLSAQQMAGDKRQGRADPSREIAWHGRQSGVVPLSDRKLRVSKPRLRRKGKGQGGEVDVPAYEAMRSGGSRLGRRILEILMNGVSTRKYEKVLPEMADSVGMSRSSVSREAIEASEARLKQLCERRFDDRDILVIYLDGIQFGRSHVLAAVGVADDGRKHVLGLREGASENSTVVTALLEDLVARGITPDRRRLFVIDGSKALRKSIDHVFGRTNPVQRCRNHKIRNVIDHLPKDQHDQTRAAMRAAFKLDADEGMARLEQLAAWLERDHPSAAGSLREGLSEMFTINRLGLPASLRRCLSSTNVIDSSHSGLRQRTGRVTNWQDGSMVIRWAAAAFLATEKQFRKILGHQQLWMLKAHFDHDENTEVKRAG